MAIVNIFTFNKFSKGAEELSKALGIKRLKMQGSTFRGGPNKTVINWGSTNIPDQVTDGGTRILNTPDAIAQAVDKTTAFNTLSRAGVSIPNFTTDPTLARRWVEGGNMVFARTLPRASSGRGIVIMDPEHPDTWDVRAPLYVMYVNKKYEYRIHVMRGEVIDRQRKGLAPEFQGQQDINWKIRNMANGFVFVRNDGHRFPEEADRQAIMAVNALGLDFGAVDIIWNEQRNQGYVLEVNSAPGLVGTTVNSYAEAFNRLRDV